MYEKIYAIVPAGGAGAFNGIPKILDELYPGRSILGQVISFLKEAGVRLIVVVANHYCFQELIQKQLRLEHLNGEIIFALQHWRLGAAAAVAAGLEKLPPVLPDDQVLVTYADMPLWEPQTIQDLIHQHFATEATVSFISIRLIEESPESLKCYGQLVYDEEGRVNDVIEHKDRPNFDPHTVVKVNPSLYLFNRLWLTMNLFKIKPVERGDGFPAEFQLPQLLKIASGHPFCLVSELVLHDHLQAMGVNTTQDLLEVRRLFAERRQL